MVERALERFTHYPPGCTPHMVGDRVAPPPPPPPPREAEERREEPEADRSPAAPPRVPPR